MIIELHDHLGKPLKIDATRVLIMDDLGNPLSFAVQVQPNHCRVLRIDDDDFAAQLRLHGIKRLAPTVKVLTRDR